jgi:carbonic anhydrase
MKRNLLAAALCATLAFPLPVVLAENHAHWSYEGHAGSAHWGDLDESFKTCKLGKHQSPIDIETKKVQQSSLKPIVFAYRAEPAEVVNNGHTIQVNLPVGSAITIDGTEYKLLQFHFHTPSEEKINGKTYPMVAHLVHQNADKELAVIAVLFKEGKENDALKPIFDNLPPKEGNPRSLRTTNAADLLPADHTYYAFTGSLTTPPCSEEVRWLVLKTPVEISASQLAAFRKLYKMNARPTQPLNGRVVQVSQ